MNDLEKEYGVARIRRIERVKRIQRIVLLVSIVSFMGSALVGVGQLFSSGVSQDASTSSSETTSPESMLASQEEAYKFVLQREPENQTALEGLTKVRLQRNDPKGAIALLEILVKRYPDRTDYKALLTDTQQVIKGQK